MDNTDRKKRLDGLREEFMLDVLEDIDKVSKRVETLFQALPGVAVEVNAQLKPLMDEITLAIGTLQDEKEEIILRAKRKVTNEADNRSDELRRLAFDLSGKIKTAVEEGVEGSLTPAVSRPVNHAVMSLDGAVKNLHKAADELVALREGTEGELEKVKTSIEKATRIALDAISTASREQAKQQRPLWQVGALMAACVLVGAVATPILGKWLGVFVTKAEVTELLAQQRTIAARLDEIKPSRK